MTIAMVTDQPPLPLATWSTCKRYRYTLRRTWSAGDRIVAWLLLNPSTADETQDDPTIRRCINFSKSWGFDGLIIVNAYAWRSTDPAGLRSLECAAAGGPVGAGNDAAITTAVTESALTVCGWGGNLNLGDGRRAQLSHLLAGADLTALRVNSDGSPGHPLYLRGSLQPLPFSLEAPR